MLKKSLRLNNRNIYELLDMLKCRIIQNIHLKREIIVYLDFIKGYDQFEFIQILESQGIILLF